MSTGAVTRRKSMVRLPVNQCISPLKVSKYFPQCQQESDVNFQWGDFIENIHTRQYYRSCSIDGTIVSIGKNVCVKGDKDVNAVGELLELYNESKFEEDPHRARIKWYFRYSELTRKFKSKIKTYNKDHELFLSFNDDYAGCIEIIDAEVILSQCEVTTIPSDGVIPELDEDQYFVRYGFSASEGVESIIRLEETTVEDDVLSNTPQVKKKKSKAVPQSEPLKRIRKTIELVEPLTVTRDSPAKRKGSDSVYTSKEAPPVKSTKKLTTVKSKTPVKKHRKIFNTADLVSKIIDSDDEDCSNLSDGASSTSSRSSRTSNSSRLSRSSTRSKSNYTSTSPKLSSLSECFGTMSVNRSPLKQVENLIDNRDKNNKRDDIVSGRNLNESDGRRSTRTRRQTVSYATEYTSIAGKRDTLLTISKNTSDEKPSKSNSSKRTTSKKSQLLIDDSDFDVNIPKPHRVNASTRSGRKSVVSAYEVDDNDKDVDYNDTNSKDVGSDDEHESSINSDVSNNDIGSDDDFSSNEVTFKTPQRRKRRKLLNMPKSSYKSKKSQRKGSSSKTPSKKAVMTPSIGERSQPRLSAKSPLQFARQSLHVSAVPDTLPCRDNEYNDIFSFVYGRLQSQTGGCMYISGVPGTGKTATVHDVIRSLEDEVDECSLPKFQYYEINGMKLTDPNQAYCHLLKMMTGQKATPDHAASLLEKKFSQPSPRKESLVLLVDELDLLMTRKQNVMYNLFDWPTRRYSKLIVLAVANTMDLPERIMINRVSSRLGLTRMTFQPYTFKQLQEIVISRIKGINAFEEDALQLVARKVAAVSGDARRCLDICRRAVEIAELEFNITSPSKRRKGIVGMKHVESALKEMFSSPKILALQSLSLMEEMFMKALISELRRNGVEEAVFIDIYDQFKSHCRLEEGIEPPNVSQAYAICNTLGTCRLILVEAGNKDIFQRVRLNVNTDDVMFAFKVKNKEI